MKAMHVDTGTAGILEQFNCYINKIMWAGPFASWLSPSDLSVAKVNLKISYCATPRACIYIRVASWINTLNVSIGSSENFRKCNYLHLRSFLSIAILYVLKVIDLIWYCYGGEGSSFFLFVFINLYILQITSLLFPCTEIQYWGLFIGSARHTSELAAEFFLDFLLSVRKLVLSNHNEDDWMFIM